MTEQRKFIWSATEAGAKRVNQSVHSMLQRTGGSPVAYCGNRRPKILRTRLRLRRRNRHAIAWLATACLRATLPIDFSVRAAWTRRARKPTAGIADAACGDTTRGDQALSRWFGDVALVSWTLGLSEVPASVCTLIHRHQALKHPIKHDCQAHWFAVRVRRPHAMFVFSTRE